ncbi:MAG: 4-hydroxy-3-methylbut-2-enyl diphosphate reductase [Candidatus Dormibacteraeota bacterium]|uniref:4-hydroxy-3-methylbut-2-enyl diphosphate reductase n=1 Tax=Candidatus Amunia macphersoniae TaxID=3127014 RepID=A0A934KIH9_9BACT|nr:4-hydroxy-3-methylbut-2-enyl diphosphate reductase [Candidatus Dormibacteraeota bacterium]
MEVVRITPRGYCHGVVEAIRIAKRVGSERAAGEQVTMLGYLVHNEHVTRDLEEHGVALVDAPDRMKGLDQIQSGTVVFTAHGISPQVVAEAQRRGLQVVDATCSDVTRTHDLVRQLTAQGYHVVYIGKRGHPEPAGALGVAPDQTTLVERIEEVDDLTFPVGTRLAVTCQTTLSMWDTKAIIDRLVERFPDIAVHNEICLATQQRQEAAVLAATDVDCVVVVGSRRSSNSLRLVQVVEERAGKPAFLVDTAAELKPEWFAGMNRVGVTAGASTPTQLTREVIATIEALPVATMETAPVPLV